MNGQRQYLYFEYKKQQYTFIFYRKTRLERVAKLENCNYRQNVVFKGKLFVSFSVVFTDCHIFCVSILIRGNFSLRHFTVVKYYKILQSIVTATVFS